MRSSTRCFREAYKINSYNVKFLTIYALAMYTRLCECDFGNPICNRAQFKKW